VSGQQHTLATLFPQERASTHFTGGWVGPRAGLDGWNHLQSRRVISAWENITDV